MELALLLSCSPVRSEGGLNMIFLSSLIPDAPLKLLILLLHFYIFLVKLTVLYHRAYVLTIGNKRK